MDFKSVLEIYINPRDLQIFVGEDQTTHEWSFAVTRGPGHNFKPILSSRPFAKSLAEVAEGVRTLLTNVCTMAEGEISASGREGCLTPELINRITEEVLRTRAANTFEMPDPRISA